MLDQTLGYQKDHAQAMAYKETWGFLDPLFVIIRTNDFVTSSPALAWCVFRNIHVLDKNPFSRKGNSYPSKDASLCDLWEIQEAWKVFPLKPALHLVWRVMLIITVHRDKCLEHFSGLLLFRNTADLTIKDNLSCNTPQHHSLVSLIIQNYPVSWHSSWWGVVRL